MPNLRRKFEAQDGQEYSLTIQYDVDLGRDDLPEVENPTIIEAFNDQGMALSEAEIEALSIDYDDLLEWANDDAMMDGY